MHLSPRTFCSPHTDRTAFSLIELVLVLAIAIVLSAIAIPRYGDAQQRYQADATVHRIAADLRFAAERARVTSTVVNVKFEKNEDKNRYTIEGYGDPDHADAEYTVHLWDAPYSTWMFEAPGDIEFDIYGKPDRTTTIAVRAGSPGSGAVRTVSTNKDTGEVTIP